MGLRCAADSGAGSCGDRGGARSCGGGGVGGGGGALHYVGVGKNRVNLELVWATFNPELVLHRVTASRFAFDPHWQTSSSNALVFATNSIDRFNFDTEVVNRVASTRVFNQNKFERRVDDRKVGIAGPHFCRADTKIFV